MEEIELKAWQTALNNTLSCIISYDDFVRLCKQWDEENSCPDELEIWEPFEGYSHCFESKSFYKIVEGFKDSILRFHKDNTPKVKTVKDLIDREQLGGMNLYSLAQTAVAIGEDYANNQDSQAFYEEYKDDYCGFVGIQSELGKLAIEIEQQVKDWTDDEFDFVETCENAVKLFIESPHNLEAVAKKAIKRY